VHTRTLTHSHRIRVRNPTHKAVNYITLPGAKHIGVQHHVFTKYNIRTSHTDEFGPPLMPVIYWSVSPSHPHKHRRECTSIARIPRARPYECCT
jgi:hypothetical protein